MNVFFVLIANLLALIYTAIPNYAVAIIGLTLAIMIVMTPLTLKGTRSMMVMQQLQPEMKKIQTRYKDDRQKLNEELLKFYKENDISPLGGCLPLLVQMPIFLVLYQVLRGLTRRISGMGFDTGWVSGQLGTGTGPTKAPSITRNFDPAFLDHKSKMYQNLSQTNTMQAFGMDLAESAKTALSSGLGHAWPYLMLILVVGVTGFIQQRQIQGRTANQQVNPQQQMIMKLMPIFLPVISFGLPAGLVLYFAVSNLYRVGQQWFISRSIYGPHAAKLAASGASSEPAEPAVGFIESIRRAVPARSTIEGEEEPARSGSSSKRPPAAKKTPAKSTPSKTTASKSTASRSTAKKPAAKTPAKAPAKANGRTTPSKRTPTTKKDSGPANARSSAPAASTKGGAPAASPPPTLQPRARKKKG